MTFEYSKSQALAMKVGTALLKALAEHGTDNSFAFSELVGAEDAMIAGKAVRRCWSQFCLNFSSRLPEEFSDTHVNLSGGRLHVVSAATRKRQPADS